MLAKEVHNNYLKIDNSKPFDAGEWDFYINRILTEGNIIHQNKNELFRVCLIKKTSWKEIFKKCLPKGSLIVGYRRVR